MNKIKKNANRDTDSQPKNKKEEQFVVKLDDFFDVAHANALELIQHEEDKEYLLAQRRKGREGSMIGVDKIDTNKEGSVSKRKVEESRRQEANRRITRIK